MDKKIGLSSFLIIYSFLIPLGYAIQNIGVVMLFCVWLFSLFKKRRLDIYPKVLLMFFGFVLINGISLFYTENIHEGVAIFLRQFLFVVISFLIFTNFSLTVNRQLIVKCIISCAFSLLLVILINFLYQLNFFNYNITELIGKQGNTFSMGVINYDFLYLSYYILITLMLLNYVLVTEWIKLGFKIRNFLAIISVIFFIYLILLGSRLCLFIAIIGFVIIYFRYLKNNKKVTVIIIFCSLFLPITVYQLDLEIVEKYKELINYNSDYDELKNKWGGRYMRQEIWSCVFDLVKEKPIFGYGLGNVQGQIDYCLATTTKNSLLYTGKFKFNAHNQYFQFILTSGILGIIAFLLFIFTSIYNSVKSNNIFFLIFIVISSLCFLIESFLERNHGIIFFAFFGSLLYKKSLKPNSYSKNHK